jgi:hypothetical protein
LELGLASVSIGEVVEGGRMKKRSAVEAVVLAAAVVALQGCTLDDVKPASSSASMSAAAAPKGWQQTGTIMIGAKEVPVYSEIYQGEGESGYQMALNPASGKVQAFTRDEVGNIIWKLDPTEGSAP